MPNWLNEQWQQYTILGVINHATNGDNELVAAVPLAKIRVYCLKLVSRGTVLARLESGAGGTALTGQQSMAANTGWVLDWCPDGWVETAIGESLNLELSAAVNVDGEFRYRLIYQNR